MIVYLSMIDTPEDRSKFENLYIEYRDIMYHVAFKILQNEQDAEDAVHQAFLKIAEKIEKVDGTICSRTQGYVVTIVENKAIDMYRYKQKHQTFELRDDDEGIVIEYNGPNMLYLTEDTSLANGIIWRDEESGVVFFISGRADGEELIKLAKSVKQVS